MSFVAGVGYANCDLLYTGIERLPNEGEEIYAKKLDIQLGGGVPATIINLARLGLKAKFSTFLGKDIFSDYVEKQLDHFGVEYQNVYDGDKILVSVTSAMITEKDRTFMSFHDRVEITEDMEEKIYRQLTGAKVVDMHDGFLNVYRRLKEEGTILVFDVGWGDDLSIGKYREYLELADYFTPNQKEAMKITNTKTVKEAAAVLGDFFDEVIIKLDSLGCMYRKNNKTVIIPSMSGVVRVDSTGAGDAFLSGFIYGLYYGYSVPDSIAFGNVMGGTCVEGLGCLAKYATEDELLDKAKKIKIAV